MEILLLVAIVAVAASGLYVAATFNNRTKQDTAPLLDGAVKDISERIRVTAQDLRQQLQDITNELHQNRQRATRDRSEAQDRLDQADRPISSVSAQLSAVLETF